MRKVKEFLAKIDTSGGADACWPWTGARNACGYGSLNRQGKTLSAHRVAYERSFGIIPDGLHVLHRCDNPPCCNPDHLYAGTHADNMRDKSERGRARTLPRPGELSPTAKLDDGTVWLIRALAAQGAQKKDIAQVVGVNRTTVDLVVRRVTWKHVA